MKEAVENGLTLSFEAFFFISRNPFHFSRIYSCNILLGHDAADAGAFDQAVENDEQSFLVFIGELIDFLVEPVQFGIMNF
jgi:hypothetical protein